MRKIVGIIGHPIGHSLSPVMHNAAFQKLALDYEYVPFDVAPADLKEAVSGLRALHIAGFNVTIPHKETVVPLLDEVTKLAKSIGAVNTVVNQAGKLIGYNTDGPGFIASLKEDASFEPKGKKVVILGAGGASRAVATLLIEEKVKLLTISDIDENKGRELCDYLDCTFAKNDSVELTKAIEVADLLVNATPIGMAPKVGQSPLPDKTKLPKTMTVYDLVYNPAETLLIKSARAAGCSAVSGLGMLVRQGALAFELFTSEEAPVDVMWQAAESALK